MNWMTKIGLGLGVLVLAMSAHADPAQEAANAQYTGPSVADNVALMDTDKNGFADVNEVRAFLQKQHGADYEKDMLDKLAATVGGASCATPFAGKLYVSH